MRRPIRPCGSPLRSALGPPLAGSGPRRFGGRDPSKGYGLGSRSTARLSARPLSLIPIWASSPAACTAVVTSSVPLGGAAPGSSGSGESERARSVDSARAGAPARTGRGRCGSAGSRAGVAGVRGAGSVVLFLTVRGFGFGFAPAFGFAVDAIAFGFAAVFGFAEALGFAAGLAVAFAPSRDRSARRPVGRVAGRLPRTPGSSLLFALMGSPVYVSRRALAGQTINDL